MEKKSTYKQACEALAVVAAELLTTTRSENLGEAADALAVLRSFVELPTWLRKHQFTALARELEEEITLPCPGCLMCVVAH